MGFNDDLMLLLESETPQGMQDMGQWVTVDEGGQQAWQPFAGQNIDDFIDVGGGPFGQALYLDTETGQLVTAEQAMAMAPEQFRSTSDILRDRGVVRPEDDRLAAGSGTGSPDMPQPQGGGIWNWIKDSKDLIGLALTGGTAALGIGTAIAGMVRGSDGGGQVSLPDGRAIALSPQEVQLLDMAVNQARDQAKIAEVSLGAVRKSAEASAPQLEDLLTRSVTTAGKQLRGIENLTDVADAALFGDGDNSEWGAFLAKNSIAPDSELDKHLRANPQAAREYGWTGGSMTPVNARTLVEGDLKNAAAQQGVAGGGLDAMRKQVEADAAPTEAETLGTKVGMAADQRALDIMGGAIDTKYKDLADFGDEARGVVSSFITGTDALPGAYAGEDAIRSKANARLWAGLDATEAVNPAIRRLIAERREAIERQMLRDIGPGWEASTPGQRALNDFTTWVGEQVYGSNFADVSAMSGVALPRAQFLEGVRSGRASTAAPFVTGVPGTISNIKLGELGATAPIGLSRLSYDEGARQQRFGRAASAASLSGGGTRMVGDVFNAGRVGAPSPSGGVATIMGERPGALATSAFSSLANIANFQEGTANQNAITNALLEASRRNQLLSGGGQLIGQAVSPFLSQAAKSFFA